MHTVILLRMLPFCELFFKHAGTFASILEEVIYWTVQKESIELTKYALENLFGQLSNCVSFHNTLT